MSTNPDGLELTRVALEVSEGIATVMLDRPDVHNAFDPPMVNELARIWQSLRLDPDVRAIILTGRGEKAFCTGIDRSSVDDFHFDPLTYEDPGRLIGPKAQHCWKPIVAAVNGMACGGAFYMLGEADVILAAEHATFFDPTSPTAWWRPTSRSCCCGVCRSARCSGWHWPVRTSESARRLLSPLGW